MTTIDVDVLPLHFNELTDGKFGSQSYEQDQRTEQADTLSENGMLLETVPPDLHNTV